MMRDEQAASMKRTRYAVFRYLELSFWGAVGIGGAAVILKGLLLLLDRIDPPGHLNSDYGTLPGYAAALLYCLFVVFTTATLLRRMMHTDSVTSGERPINIPATAYVRTEVICQSEMTSSTPSFIQGVGSIIDIAGTLTEHNAAPTGEEEDGLALRHDWQMVGRDLGGAGARAIRKRLISHTQGGDQNEGANG